MASPNERTRRDWARKAAGWVANEPVIDHAFAAFTEALLDRAALSGDDRVLDVGCGTGTLLEAASRLGAEAVGVDICATMVDAARTRVPAALVVEGDAQDTDLLAAAPGRPFDAVVSRFGSMFFEDPVAAFSNIRAACAPGASLTLATWREGERNIFTFGLEHLLARLEDPPGPPAADRPGPMGLATGDHLGAVLVESGWEQVHLEALDAECDYGFDGSDGVDQRLSAALAGTLGTELRRRIESDGGPGHFEMLLEETRRDPRADGRRSGAFHQPRLDRERQQPLDLSRHNRYRPPGDVWATVRRP
ncbi:MAG: class I SAM-dependent methyltransferase [Microthrixaceae bacterium]